jgi:hypothetical protein
MHNALDTVRSRVGAVGLMTLGLLGLLVGPAAAQTSPEAVVNSAVSGAADTATSVVVAGIPIILAVAAIWVALKFGKQLLSKI